MPTPPHECDYNDYEREYFNLHSELESGHTYHGLYPLGAVGWEKDKQVWYETKLQVIRDTMQKLEAIKSKHMSALEADVRCLILNTRPIHWNLNLREPNILQTDRVPLSEQGAIDWKQRYENLCRVQQELSTNNFTLKYMKPFFRKTQALKRKHEDSISQLCCSIQQAVPDAELPPLITYD